MKGVHCQNALLSCKSGLPLPKDLPLGALPLPRDLEGTMPGPGTPGWLGGGANNDSKPGIELNEFKSTFAKLSSPGIELNEFKSIPAKVAGAGAGAGAGAALGWMRCPKPRLESNEFSASLGAALGAGAVGAEVP